MSNSVHRMILISDNCRGSKGRSGQHEPGAPAAIGGQPLKPEGTEPDNSPDERASAARADQFAELEQRIESFRQAVASARMALEQALERAQETRSSGRAHAEAARSEALQRAQAIIAAGERKAQEVLQRGSQDAEVIEAQSYVQAEAAVAEAQCRLQEAMGSALTFGHRPSTSPFSAAIGATAPDALEASIDRGDPYEFIGLPAESPVLDSSPAEMVLSPEPAVVERELSAESPFLNSSPAEMGLSPEPAVVEREPETGVHTAQPLVADNGRPNGLDIPSQQAPSIAEPGAPESNALELAVLTRSDEKIYCRVTGPLPFPRMLALEKVVSDLPSVRSAEITPQPKGATLLIVSDEPDRTLADLLRLSDFPMQAAHG